MAIKSLHYEAIEFLLKNGAKLDISNKNINFLLFMDYFLFIFVQNMVIFYVLKYY